jgi:DNA polymerase III epsilon subunit-like protein
MIVVDIETTGIDPSTNSIVSIGAVNFINTKQTFYDECNVFDNAEINLESLKINGFSKKEIIDNKDKHSEREIIVNFLKWLNNQNTEKIIAGQNPSFDRDFLIKAFERNQMTFPMTFRTVDLNTLCVNYVIKNNLDFKISRLNTNRIYEILEMPSEPNPHNALTGALMETEAFYRLIYGKNILEDYRGYPVPENLLIS